MITVIISVLVMILLSLFRVNVVLAILAAGITAGLMSGLGLNEGLDLLITGMGGQAETALSYILLGVFAMMIGYSGITGVLVSSLVRVLKGKRGFLIMVIAAAACLSQNVIPVHIAFIPILIPPLLKLFDEMNIDRRAVASALTFGLKAPYVMLPVGFGFIFHNTIAQEMAASGMEIAVNDIWKAMFIPGLGMIAGLLIAVFVTYRKPRKLETEPKASTDPSSYQDAESSPFTMKHIFTILAVFAALIIQIGMDSLIFGALSGIILMFIFRVVPFRHGDDMVNDGVKLMGMIAFVMLIASGFANVLEETGAVDDMVSNAVSAAGGANVMTAAIMLLAGLVVTMGIGTSFGTIPILAALFVPFCMSVGFSPLATVALIGTAGAMGDAGSPASDSTLGPTSGLNADGRHHHIWDTCVPTFLHYNIPLFLFGLIAAVVL
ncbi:Na+/H+ antiporter family protein [Alteribacillus sp. YIM 98480]|uniref:Na+/H+ antiporter family protein n=1 Tax=Alteribacillus sp. YIM 98480 TaxID=2606599 RepID=UPI00131E916D|nr:Na+/H+ antiporter NhaC family protein [Alteribacillus sp. YIM 98480]